MTAYALIKAGTVVNIIDADPAFVATIAPEWDAIVPPPEGAGIGWTWDGQRLAPPLAEPAAELPRIVITAIDAGEHAAHTTVADDFSLVRTTAGAILTITGQLMLAGALLRLSDEFDMPVRSTDGRETLVTARMDGGIITVRIRMESAGTWTVTEDEINRDLPEPARMAFAGITVRARQPD